jgi:acetyl-CoA acetyltransferase
VRDVAVVCFAQSPCAAADRSDDMAEILLPVIRDAVSRAGIRRDEIGFFASGSHDFFEGRTFAYIDSLDAVGAWPPISESHVEMDAAWACYEAWAWLQLGEGDVALVYGIGRGSLAQDLDQVMATQLDPYVLAPLRPPRDAFAGLQAAAAVAAGITSEQGMAEVVARCLAAARDNPFASKSGDYPVASLMAAPYVASPLRAHDVAPAGDAAAVLILAAGPAARRLAAGRLTARPAWVRGMDHRMDTHYPGFRDLTAVDSARIAGARASELAGFAASAVDVAELHTSYSYAEPLLAVALGLSPDVAVNPSGGPLAGQPVTATGLIRIGEAAQRIMDGRAGRALAHATSGPALQQNLVCLMAGEP